MNVIYECHIQKIVLNFVIASYGENEASYQLTCYLMTFTFNASKGTFFLTWGPFSKFILYMIFVMGRIIFICSDC